jgi:1,4-dihydroxy-2-naphthoate octaprenyltransferase
MENVRLNSPRAWLLAARPKTLTGAAVPVMMALALAWVDCQKSGAAFSWVAAVLCLLFAFIMQIDANFINDYFDFKKGTDDEQRLGPRRACAQGWVSEPAMRRAIGVTTAVASLVGLPLIAYGGWQMVAVGALCVLFCFLYTTHLSYVALGDVLVLVFFGIVPVCITYYLQLHTVSKEVFYSSLACGMVIDTLLVVNNYRDRDNDRRAGKTTLVLLMGERASELFFLLLGLMAFHMGLVFFFTGRYFTFFLPAVYLSLHARTARRMRRIKHGKALNLILGQNARNMFFYGLLFSAGVLLDFYLLG